jgi:hypothetical protein
MGITEVKSPISSSHRNTVAGGQPLSPGARSMPGARGRADQAPPDEPQPSHARVSLGGGDEPARVTIHGPQEHDGGRPLERHS